MLDTNVVAADVSLIREKSPLVHNITNYVVMNNTANALLALGASPVMAHAVEEVEAMVRLAKLVGGALVINMGTLSPQWVDAMELAMKTARAQHVPIVFDPVGAGATPYRTESCQRLLQANAPSIIRGNASEIMSLTQANVQTKGVDSASSTDAAREAADQLARAFDCVVTVSGEVDVVTDGCQRIEIRQGHAMMARVTGLGCTASALIGAFAAVQSDLLLAAAHAMTVMGVAGEVAASKSPGPGSLQMHFLDALYQMDEKLLSE